MARSGDDRIQDDYDRRRDDDRPRDRDRNRDHDDDDDYDDRDRRRDGDRPRGRGRDRDDYDDDDYDDRDRRRRYEDDDYQMPEHVPNYLVPSILVTLLCCWPFGVAALVNSTKVDAKVKEGDYREARRLSDKAKTWCIISFILGFIVNMLIVGAQIAQAIHELD